MGQNDGNGTGPAGQGGHGFPENFHISGFQHALNAQIHDLPTRFARYHHPGLNLTQFDGAGDQEYPVQYTQTGVGNIVDHRSRAHPQFMAYSAGRGRFELIPTDTAVDQHADPIRRNTRCMKRFLAGPCRAFVHWESRIPVSAFADTGNHFKLAFLEMKRLVKRLQTVFDIIGCQNVRCQLIANAVQINGIEFHKSTIIIHCNES